MIGMGPGDGRAEFSLGCCFAALWCLCPGECSSTGAVCDLSLTDTRVSSTRAADKSPHEQKVCQADHGGSREPEHLGHPLMSNAFF